MAPRANGETRRPHAGARRRYRARGCGWDWEASVDMLAAFVERVMIRPVGKEIDLEAIRSIVYGGGMSHCVCALINSHTLRDSYRVRTRPCVGKDGSSGIARCLIAMPGAWPRSDLGQSSAGSPRVCVFPADPSREKMPLEKVSKGPRSKCPSLRLVSGSCLGAGLGLSWDPGLVNEVRVSACCGGVVDDSWARNRALYSTPPKLQNALELTAVHGFQG